VNPVFVDTGFLIAVEMVQDQHHSSAIDAWRRILRSPPQLVTTSFVVAELVTFFVSRGRHAKAVDLAENLRGSSGIHLVHVDQELFEAGFEYLKRRPDKRFSLTDCISFVVMNRMAIREALTFDAHFEQAGFIRLPSSTR